MTNNEKDDQQPEESTPAETIAETIAENDGEDIIAKIIEEVAAKETEETEEAEKIEEVAPTAEEQIAALNDQLLRALAEIDNTRRRGERERSEALKYGAVNFARDILSVADNLRRALASLEDVSADDTQNSNPAIAPLIEGIAATERDLLATLQRHRISVINPQGEAFDPNRHEALFEVPTDTHTAGQVVEVVEVGYMLEDRLLRPAKVGIAKAPETA